MKIRSAGAELFDADGQTKEMTKLIVTFRSSAKAPNTHTDTHSIIFHIQTSWQEILKYSLLIIFLSVENGKNYIKKKKEIKTGRRRCQYKFWIFG